MLILILYGSGHRLELSSVQQSRAGTTRWERGFREVRQEGGGGKRGGYVLSGPCDRLSRGESEGGGSAGTRLPARAELTLVDPFSGTEMEGTLQDQTRGEERRGSENSSSSLN